MSFVVYEYSKNNRQYTKRDESAWHNKIITNSLRFICLFVNVNEMVKTYKDGQTLRYGKINDFIFMSGLKYLISFFIRGNFF